MIPVMIVEDEPMIRTGLERVIPWEELGCEVVTLAVNGEDGLAKAAEYRPKLIISDIRMPKMDGLDMVQQLQSTLSEAHVIFLTGYKEFDYAKRAIEYGVEDYVLKPVDQDELCEVIKRLVEKIDAEASLERERELLKTKVQDSIPILRDKFLADLLFNNPRTIYHIYEKMEYFHLDVDEFCLLDIEIDSFHDLEKNFTEDDIQILLFLIVDQIEQLLAESGFTAITFNHDKSVYVIMGRENEPIVKEKVFDFCTQLADNIEKRAKFTISVGISTIGNGALQIRSACREAQKSVGQSSYLGAGSVISYSDLVGESNQRKENIELDTDAYYQALKSGMNMENAFQELYEQMKGFQDSVLARSVITELIAKTFRMIHEEDGETQQAEEIFNQAMEKMHYAKTVQNMLDIVEETGRWIIDYVQQKQQSRTQYIMDQAISYMKENCSREVSLEEVADHVFVSKWYFSKLFRKEKGIKFSDYFSVLRIEQAQKIIRENPTLKNYEVAEMTGFGNDRYFSQLFKKVTGMTPTEFRG